MYSQEWGDRGLVIKQWARHLVNYEDGRFARDQMFTLFTYSTADAIRVARFMGIVVGETTRWPSMILLHHHDSILIVDKDNVIVNIK